MIWGVRAALFAGSNPPENLAQISPRGGSLVLRNWIVSSIEDYVISGFNLKWEPANWCTCIY